jgi:hypothetical protein
VFPSLWASLDELIKQGTVFSCDEVYIEIQKKTDDLAEWAKARKAAFHVPDNEVTSEMQDYGPVSQFCGDGWIAKSSGPVGCIGCSRLRGCCRN